MSLHNSSPFFHFAIQFLTGSRISLRIKSKVLSLSRSLKASGETVKLSVYSRLSFLMLQGGLYGAMFLDENFLKMLDQKIPLATRTKLKRQGIQKIMRDEWESGIKTSLCKASKK